MRADRGAAGSISCPKTQDVIYDFSKSSAELSRMKSDTVSPFAPGTRTVTEGLRVDQPAVSVGVSESYQMVFQSAAVLHQL